MNKVFLIGTGFDGMSLGDLTVNQMLTVMVKVIDKINNLTPPNI